MSRRLELAVNEIIRRKLKPLIIHKVSFDSAPDIIGIHEDAFKWLGISKDAAAEWAGIKGHKWSHFLCVFVDDERFFENFSKAISAKCEEIIDKRLHPTEV